MELNIFVWYTCMVQSLYLKYRPKTMGEVIGQPMAQQMLLGASRKGELGQAYLFEGPRGTGKTSVARILAKMLNCENLVDGDADGTCDSCVNIEKQKSFDVIEIDGASNSGVAEAKKLVGQVKLSSPGKKKVYILDEAHMLTPQAWNALLKTLEDIPEHVVFVMATTEPQKLLPTVKSRLQTVSFGFVNQDVLMERVKEIALAEEINMEEGTFDRIVRESQGSVRDALTLLQQYAYGVSPEVDIEDFVGYLCDRNLAGSMKELDIILASGFPLQNLVVRSCEIARWAFHLKMGHNPPGLGNDERIAAERLASVYRAGRFTEIMETLGSTLPHLRNSPDPRVSVEVAVIQLTRFDI